MKKIIYSVLLFLCVVNYSNSQEQLPAWEQGCLDVHFISTGCGSSAFVIMPDGTNMLVDAGEMDPTSPRVLSPRNTKRFPDYSKMAYQWQADYIQSMMPKGHDNAIDYALITHYHDDHYGGMYPGIPKSAKGDYYLSGIIGVADLIPIGKLVDRGWDYPIDLKTKKADTDLQNYIHFVETAAQNKSLQYEPFKVGATDQFAMCVNPKAYPTFSIVNVFANGQVLQNGKIVSKMPTKEELSKQNGRKPGENELSCGILLKYGNFKFILGGDIPGTAPVYEQKPDWADVESFVAPLIGEVDIATANHHANRDAMSANYLRVLKPRVIIQDVWSSDHPGHEALIRMTSQNIWKGERDLFSTNMLEANKLVIGELIDRSYKAMQGHIVVRVAPGGDSYMVYVLSNEYVDKRLIATFGPYNTKSGKL